MAGPEGDRAAIWYGRLKRIALPFGVLQLAWTVLQVYLLVVGVETVRPLPFVQLLLNTGGALGLIWLALQYRRQRRE